MRQCHNNVPENTGGNVTAMYLPLMSLRRYGSTLIVHGRNVLMLATVSVGWQLVRNISSF